MEVHTGDDTRSIDSLTDHALCAPTWPRTTPAPIRRRRDHRAVGGDPGSVPGCPACSAAPWLAGAWPTSPAATTPRSAPRRDRAAAPARAARRRRVRSDQRLHRPGRAASSAVTTTATSASPGASSTCWRPARRRPARARVVHPPARLPSGSARSRQGLLQPRPGARQPSVIALLARYLAADPRPRAPARPRTRGGLPPDAEPPNPSGRYPSWHPRSTGRGT